MIVCDKCNGKFIKGSKFCPHCGDPVNEADLPEIALAESQVSQVQLSFGLSSSANYEHAINICKNIPSYNKKGKGKSIIHTVALPITEIELLINLYNLVGSWKSSKMLINGQPSTKSSLVYHGAGCFRNHQKAYKPEQYCFGEKDYDINIWGCVRMDMPISTWGGGWLEYGSMDSSGTWHFDKDRIRHDLELRIHENRLCPILDRKRIMETLDKLPNKINPKIDENWTYQTSYEEVGDDYKEVATGIKPVLREVNHYIIGDFKPTWNIEEMEGSSREFLVDVQDETQKRNSKSGCLGILLLGILLLGFLFILMF